MKKMKADDKKKYAKDAYIRASSIPIGIALSFLFIYNPNLYNNKVFNIIMCLILILFFFFTCDYIVVHGWLISIVCLSLYFIMNRIVMSFFDPSSSSYDGIKYGFNFLFLTLMQIPLIIEDYIKYKKDDKK